MKIRRTANAGVLIETDGISILLDGVCKKVEQYLETPDYIRKELTDKLPDAVLFTHKHDDHYDEAYAVNCKEMTLRPENGSEVFFLKNGEVKIRAVLTRHIGKADIFHVSFIIEGEKCIWFMGDASPMCLKEMKNLPSPDVFIAPFAYANTQASWKTTKSLGAKDIIIIHLPERGNDPYSLWNMVEETTKSDSSVHIPRMGETVILN